MSEMAEANLRDSKQLHKALSVCACVWVGVLDILHIAEPLPGAPLDEGIKQPLWRNSEEAVISFGTAGKKKKKR